MGARDNWLYPEATEDQHLCVAEPGIEKCELACEDGVCGSGIYVIVGWYQILESGYVWIGREKVVEGYTRVFDCIYSV